MADDPLMSTEEPLVSTAPEPLSTPAGNDEPLVCAASPEPLASFADDPSPEKPAAPREEAPRMVVKIQGATAVPEKAKPAPAAPPQRSKFTAPAKGPSAAPAEKAPAKGAADPGSEKPPGKKAADPKAADPAEPAKPGDAEPLGGDMKMILGIVAMFISLVMGKDFKFDLDALGKDPAAPGQQTQPAATQPQTRPSTQAPQRPTAR